MKKCLLMLGLLVLCLTLCSCGSGKETDPQLPESTPAPALSFSGNHPLAQTAAQVLSPYVACLRQVDENHLPSISHRIPEDMFSLLVTGAENNGAAAEAGRYVFAARNDSTHTYQVTAMESTSAASYAATPNPADETPMDNTKMGDYVASGGGTYHRTYLMDVQEDLSQGSIELTTTLNGENAGHEIYTFFLRSDGFYFVDAAADLSVSLDTLESSGQYLVTVGRLTESKAEILEYHVNSLEEVPSPESLDFEWLKNTTDRLSYLCATPEGATLQ